MVDAANAPDSDGIVLSEDQGRGTEQIYGWVRKPTSPFFTLGGYAGTGKTTVVNKLCKYLRGMKILVCAYTGKAAYVLRQKGIQDACTIHSAIYQPQELCKNCGLLVERNVDGDYKPCNRQSECENAGHFTHFDRAETIDADLIIVDEASMVSTEIHQDLLSYERPILYVGDHGQLEPIGKSPGLMRDPMVRLETIHRQAEGNPILQFAQHVRKHGHPCSFGDEAQVVISGKVPRDAHAYDMVICGKNSTRVAVNARIRKNLGFTGRYPHAGERVICLRNDKKRGLFNGMIATVTGVDNDEDLSCPELDIVTDEGTPIKGIKFAVEQFGAEETLEHVSRKRALFDYGYCITGHKSQGSEFASVLVLEWIHPDWAANRWRYTAATRAKERLVWCMHR